jgi:hypothetical protein
MQRSSAAAFQGYERYAPGEQLEGQADYWRLGDSGWRAECSACEGESDGSS